MIDWNIDLPKISNIRAAGLARRTGIEYNETEKTYA